KVESAPAPDIAPAGESYADPTPEQEQGKPSPAPSAPAPAEVKANGSSGGGAGDAGYVSPLVRKLATEKGVDLAKLTGTGVGGRIRKQDVVEAADKAAADKAAAAKAAPAPAPAAAKQSTPAAPKAAPSPLRGRTEKLTR